MLIRCSTKGNILAGIVGRLQRWLRRDTRILILGIDAAGKTTLLYRLKLHETVAVIPSIGFLVETFRHVNVTFTAWDVSGGSGMRPLWRHYYQDTRAIVFVVDAADIARLEEVRECLHEVFTGEELQNCPLLILANKQDREGARSPAQLQEALDIATLPTATVHIQPTVITLGTGIDDGFDWLVQQLP